MVKFGVLEQTWGLPPHAKFQKSRPRCMPFWGKFIDKITDFDSYRAIVLTFGKGERTLGLLILL